ncbi:MAG: manganese efflux pump [Candidatus Methanofastidiosa archaeon]|nr:manganese efflux pump [Candidatus Methanofastidiosa archaeon]
MELFTILLIAIGLSVDALAVSVTSGLVIKNPKINDALKISASFGIFQAFMPLIGWVSGIKISNLISSFDHWIAFFILVFIGIKTIYETTRSESKEKKFNPLDFKVLMALSIATSIDALAVGLSFAFLEIDIVGPFLIIGFVTFIICFIGFFMGDKFGHLFENKVKVIGGAILIIIGFRILIEHVIS